MAFKHSRGFALTLLCTSACVAQATAPPPVGRFVEFTTEDPAVSLCEGTPDRWDRHVTLVQEFLHEEIPADLRVAIHVGGDSPCSGFSCYDPDDRTIYIKLLESTGVVVDSIVEHELTLALIDRAWGRSIPSLQEGLASALTTRVWASPRAGYPVHAALERPPGAIDYLELGRFVRFLIDRYGIARFKNLYQTTRSSSIERIDANFVDIYGQDLPAIEAQYASGEKRCNYQLDVCDLSAGGSVGTRWSETFAASCLDPDFYGSSNGDRESFATQRTLRIETTGRYRLRASLPAVMGTGGSVIGSRVMLVRCGDCDEQAVRYVIGESEFTLTAGVYTLYLQPAGDSIVDVEVTYLDG